MNFTLVELTRIKLEPDEVLTVKLFGDDFTPEDLESLQGTFKNLFPNNKILIFSLPNGSDLQMEAVKANMENKELTQLVDTLNELPAKDCSVPTSYCNDCGCGKKEMIESQKAE